LKSQNENSDFKFIKRQESIKTHPLSPILFSIGLSGWVH
jgi:hypothetical protein